MAHIRLAFLFLLLCPPALILEQGCTSVPEGERTSVSGIVRDSSGRPIPGVEVSVVNLEKEISKKTITDMEGGFEVSGLPPGKYQVRADVSGVNQDTKDVTLTRGQAATVGLILGGPVPDGELNKSNKTVEVVESTFEDQVMLQMWIKTQAERGKRLEGIIPVKYNTSLFLLSPTETAAVTPDLVQRVDRPLRSEELVAYINLHPDITFIGLHRLSDNSYLMVFRYGRR